MGMEMDRLNSSEEKMNEEAEGKICSTEVEWELVTAIKIEY